MLFDKRNLSNHQLQLLYENLLRPRMIEEKMLILLRQGKVSKWFSGIGQEAIAVGSTLALNQDEYILPLHRNLGVFTSRNIPFSRLFAQWQGKFEGFSKGRERSFHFGTNEFHIVGMISHLGAMLGVADGIALASRLSGEGRVTLVYSGDGGASEGDFHEAINVAAVWDLPVIFLIENNGYGLSTPSNEQYRFKYFIDKGPGYGIDVLQVDGNNILEVYNAVSQIAEDIRQNPRPILLECMTFRMRGHEEASGTKYVPQELFDEWGKKDPVKNFEDYLLRSNVIDKDIIAALREKIKAELDEGIDKVMKMPEIVPDTAFELNDVFSTVKTYEYGIVEDAVVPFNPAGEKGVNKRFIDAITDGLETAMNTWDTLVLMGQDIAEYGGAFKITQGFSEKFGKHRVRNTPLCESAIVGACLGLSIKGYKAMMEMQFADFVSVGFNQIVNNLAKNNYRWGQCADVVIRMPTGAGVGAGPFHSQSNEAWFVHTPGLKVVYPSNAYDAKGLLLAAFNDPNPVMYFEHKALYRSNEEFVPDGFYEIPIGKARVMQEGIDATIITYGMGVHWALEAAKQFSDHTFEILDLRSLLPWDHEMVRDAVKKTGKVIILHEDTLTGGISGEISAWITQHCFQYLDAPVIRAASIDTPVPFSIPLEQNFLPKQRFIDELRQLLHF
jgi:2-oxoisovalerate dehydrogenase E1 component